MFHIFFLSVVLFFVMFFSLAARYIRQFDDQPAENDRWIWYNVSIDGDWGVCQDNCIPNLLIFSVFWRKRSEYCPLVEHLRPDIDGTESVILGNWIQFHSGAKESAEGGTRTRIACATRLWNVRVYQFHHFGLLYQVLDSNANPWSSIVVPLRNTASISYIYINPVIGAQDWIRTSTP